MDSRVTLYLSDGGQSHCIGGKDLSMFSQLGLPHKQLGILRIHKDRSGIDFLNLIQDTPHGSEIKMFGITLRDVQSHNIRNAIEAKLQAGCKVKLLLLDRNSKFVEQRANEEIEVTGKWKTWHDWRNELIAFADLHEAYIENLPTWIASNIKLAYYDAPPIYSIFTNGKTMVVGLNLSGELGSSSYHLELEVKDGGIHSTFEAFFDALWPTDL